MQDEIIYIEECGSTNSGLIELNEIEFAKKGLRLEEGIVLCTGFQTAGRGQHGNFWESEKGKNLTFSMLLHPEFILASDQFILSQIVSLAIKETFDRYTDDITIKWPNDIYWKDKKICGILIENAIADDCISQSVIGIGINVNQTEFRSNAPNPVSLKLITQQNYGLNALLKLIRTNIQLYYLEVRERSPIDIVHRYKKALYRSDGYYPYNDGKDDFEAKIKDILPSGILQLETREGETRQFAFKEVSFKI